MKVCPWYNLRFWDFDSNVCSSLLSRACQGREPESICCVTMTRGKTIGRRNSSAYFSEIGTFQKYSFRLSSTWEAMLKKSFFCSIEQRKLCRNAKQQYPLLILAKGVLGPQMQAPKSTIARSNWTDNETRTILHYADSECQNKTTAGCRADRGAQQHLDWVP